jgi:FkbM family methyltransferase
MTNGTAEKAIMFISYAQNFEDVMLHRVFGSVVNGFYIDVGAWHPDIDSVTRHFYDMGWTGINIEPSKTYFKLLKKRRPRDMNLDVAIGSRTRKQDYIEVTGSGLSSLDEQTTERVKRYGFASQRYSVSVTTLQKICEQHCAGKVICFLKIDVEGFEREVVESLDWTRNRPIVVVVEAVHPDTRLPMWESWEQILLDARYLCVWFDGINRFYLRRESEELTKHFIVPPGIADGFVLNSHHPLCMRFGTRLRLDLRAIIPPIAYDFGARLLSAVRR